MSGVERAIDTVRRWVRENEVVGACDFCSRVLAEEFFTYTTDGDFTERVPLPDGTTHDFNYDTKWAACQICDPVVAEGDPVKLATHAIANRDVKRAGPLVAPRQVMQDLVRLYRKFYSLHPKRSISRRPEDGTMPFGQIAGAALADRAKAGSLERLLDAWDGKLPTVDGDNRETVARWLLKDGRP